MRLTPVPPLSVLYSDNHLLVVDKPVGIATMGSPQETQTIARLAALYLQRKYNKPGKAFIGVVSRLDRLVSGVLLLARTSKAASRISEQLRQQSVEKFYMAIVEGRLPTSPGSPAAWREVVDWVAKDESAQRMRVVDESHPQAQVARLRIQPLANSGEKSLVKIELLTGRKHQIRLQLAEQGTPIWGDTKYGARGRFVARGPTPNRSSSGSPMGTAAEGRDAGNVGSGIALHCQQLSLIHPTLKHTMVFESSPLAHWPQMPAEFEKWLAVKT
ncbi:MAG: RluA family pseudouridine synthase [Planctomycetales bacterium]|nr:RluA family pseudouridine synthase [Planctomycetales bacterium]